MQAGGGRRGKGWLLAALLPLALCSCVQQGVRAPIRALALSPLKGEIGVKYQRHAETEKSKDPAQPETKSRKTETDETLGLATSGYIYHPNIVDLGLAGTFGLRQFDFSDSAGNRQTDGTLTDFDVEGKILKKKAYPMSFLWRRQSDTISRLFAPPVQQESTVVNTSLRLVSPKFPTGLTFSRLHTIQNSPFAAPGEPDNLDLTEDAFGWNTDVLFAPDHTLRWNATASRLRSTEVLQRREDERDLSLEDSLVFGSRKQFDLNSQLGYLDRTGSSALTQWSWDERLNVQHRENLKTRYSFDSRRLDRPEGAQQTDQFGLGLYHKLYESLITNAGARLTQITFPAGATQDEIDGLVAWDYRKKNPLGVLRGFLKLERTDRQDSGPVSIGSVVDEEHLLEGTTPERLSATRIDLGTVVVTDPTRTTTYDLGDYVLRRVGNFVELERLLGGDIPDPGPVLVSYNFQVGGDLETITDRWSTGLRQEFSNGFAVYGRHYTAEQALSGATGGAVPDNVDSNILGAEYTWRNFHLQAEAERRDSTIQPVNSRRLKADYSSRFARDLAMRAGADYTVDTFTAPPERNRKIGRLFGGLDYRSGPSLSVDTYVAYVHSNDDLEGVTKGFTLRSGLSWKIRRITVDVHYEHNVLDQSASSDRSDDSLTASISRKF